MNIHVAELVITILKSSTNTVNGAAETLDDGQLFHKPTADSNPIAWLIWHLSRTKDTYSAILSEQPTIWTDKGWARQFGLDDRSGGFGDTISQVDGFRPSRDLLFNYFNAVQIETTSRLAMISHLDLEKEYDFFGHANSGLRLLSMMVIDVVEHTGQIAYLRGMLTGKGWNPY